MKNSLLNKPGLLTLMFSILMIKAASQSCLPLKPIQAPTTGINATVLEELIENRQVVFPVNSLNAFIEQIESCNNQLRNQLQETERKISEQYMHAQKIFKLSQDLYSIPNRIETLNKNKSDSEFRYNWMYASFFRQHGIYAILLKDISLREDSSHLSNIANRELMYYVNDNLCHKTYKQLNKIEKGDVTKGVYDAFVNCDVKNDEVLFAHKNEKERYFLYIASYILSLKPEFKPENTEEGKRTNIFITELTPKKSIQSHFPSDLVSKKDMEMLAAKIDLDVSLAPLIKFEVDKMNAFQLGSAEKATEQFDIYFNKNQTELEKAQSGLKKTHRELEKSLVQIGLPYNPNDWEQSIKKAFDQIRINVEPLEKQWLRLKEGEIFQKSEIVNVKDFQANPHKVVSIKSLALWNSLQERYYKLKKNEDVVLVEDMGVDGFELNNPARRSSFFRKIKAMNVFAAQIDKQNVKITMLANFKINSLNDLMNELGAKENNKGTFTDNRDGQSYKWVRLKDNKIWMAQNLNFKTKNSKCYGDDKSYCDQYGSLYHLTTAKISCPFGWRLPTNEEWDAMLQAYGSEDDSTTLIESINSKKSFKSLIKGGDSEFSVLLGGSGSFTGKEYSRLGEIGYYWSSNYPYRYKFSGLKDTSVSKERYGIQFPISCRCILDYSKNATELVRHSGYFTDPRDGKTYPWVRLKDGKKWMTSNLNYDMDESWCYNENEYSCKKYGRLYTWQAAQKACPEGWRLPSDNEFWRLANFFGMPENSSFGQAVNEGPDAGKALAKALKKNGESGFSVQYGGKRILLSKRIKYYGLKNSSNYWSSSDLGPFNAWFYFFGKYKSLRFMSSKKDAFSCRCIQD